MAITKFQKGTIIALLCTLAVLNYITSSGQLTLTYDDESIGWVVGGNNNNNKNNDADQVRRLTHCAGTNKRERMACANLRRRQAKIARRRRQYAIAREKSQRRAQTLRKLDRNKQTALTSTEPERHLIQAINTNQQQQQQQPQTDDQDTINTSPLTICNRTTDVGTANDFYRLQQYSRKSTCPGTNPQTNPNNSILFLDGTQARGRTGNALIEFLRALQYSRDKDVQLGILYGSWAMRVLLQMWMALDTKDEDEWIARFEEAFCLKIFKSEEELLAEGKYDVQKMTAFELYHWISNAPLTEYMANQEDHIRTLWQGYNTGEGVDTRNQQVQDMCSGINALFGGGEEGEGEKKKSTNAEEEERANAIYSVIHSRSLEEAGPRLLSRVSRLSGCDRTAALEMKPDYIKSILEPLGMLHFPIVLITDGQNFQVLQRLLADPDIGPQLRLVPPESSWIGGDLTLALMSNVFIGNPASTFSGFIAKSRVAMGFGHNYLFRKWDEKSGKWVTSCGEECIFDRNVMGVMS